MRIRTRKIETRFMLGNRDIDGEISDILRNEHGLKNLLYSNFDTDNAIYSDGFIKAIEDGKIPMLELHDTTSQRFYNELTEYHHVIINGECYNVYFKENENENE